MKSARMRSLILTLSKVAAIFLWLGFTGAQSVYADPVIFSTSGLFTSSGTNVLVIGSGGKQTPPRSLGKTALPPLTSGRLLRQALQGPPAALSGLFFR
jgi:hypothetical protein